MEESWENWHLHTEMDCDDDFFIDKYHTDDDKFLREILLQQPSAFSSESESDHHPFLASSTAAAEGGVLSSEGMEEQSKSCSNSKRPRRSSSPKTFILSFNNGGSMMPATREPCLNYDQFLGTQQGKRSPKNLSSKRTLDEPKERPNHGAKKPRSSSQTIDHIMAERKRRQELTERFIALSATIPGLSKTDKASVLRAAIDYVKKLKERVQELEKHDKKRASVETVIVIQKPDVSGNELDPTSSETSCDDCSILPEIEARMLGNEVLVEIHCEKQNGIELKIMDHLENLHLSVTGTSVLPFGNSALSLTIIAQMGEGYKMTVNDLVKSIRQLLLNM